MAAIKVTREELYEQVWTTPMSRLALHYGITDVGLAKTCRRMNIPRPGRGYWQQLAAHVKVKRVPLPKGSEHTQWTFLERVENVAERTPKVPSPVPPAVPIPETLHGAHEAVQRLASLLSRADADDFDRLVVGERKSPVLSVTVATHRRALLLLDARCKTLVGRAHAVMFRREKVDAGMTARLAITVSGSEVRIAWPLIPAGACTRRRFAYLHEDAALTPGTEPTSPRPATDVALRAAVQKSPPG